MAFIHFKCGVNTFRGHSIKVQYCHIYFFFFFEGMYCITWKILFQHSHTAFICTDLPRLHFEINMELSNNILAMEIHRSCVCTFSTFQRAESVAQYCLIGNRCNDWQVMSRTAEESPYIHFCRTERIKHHILRVKVKISLKS